MQNPLHYVRSELTLRRLSRRETIALVAINLCALLLYAARQHGRIFIGDEIGTLRYLQKSPTYILTHFGGQLSMNYFILVEKGVAWLCGAMDWRLTLLPLAAAIAIIPLTASVTLKFTGSTRTALIAAGVTAFNPYLVMWAPMIRSYSLLLALTLLAINEFFRWYHQRDWWNGVQCSAVVILLLLAHLNGVYPVIFLVLLLAVEAVSAGWSGGRKFIWESRTLWIPLAGAAVVVGVAYWRLLPDIAKVNREWGTDTPPTSMGYLPQVFTTYMGVGYAAFVSILLLLAGGWSAVREKRALLLLCGAIILAPILMSLQGLSVPPWTYARYLVFSLPLVLIVMAEGIDWLASRIWHRRAAIAAWGLTGLIFVCWAPYVHAQFLAKKQWPFDQIAKFLHAQMQNNDVIVAGWSIGFTLSQFFDHPEAYIILPDEYVNRVANKLDAALPARVFYVAERSVANGRTTSVRHFGQAEVTIYTGDTARSLLLEWREDLLRRTAGRVYAPFQGDYELLALLEERLPSGQSADHWRSLAERCRAQSPAARDVPLHLQKTTPFFVFP